MKSTETVLNFPFCMEEEGEKAQCHSGNTAVTAAV